MGRYSQDMTLHRPPLISNRLEFIVLILLSFIISTRLIWLQIEDRPPAITDEFYGTSLIFNRTLAHSCPTAPDSNFPYSSTAVEHSPSSNGVTSPGLEVFLWAICHTERLSVRSFMDYAPILIGLSAFLVALTSRLLTSNWVGGLLAASVVLSRGSILQGTHVAGTAVLIQPMICLVFGLMCLYARTRDARWLPVISAAAVLSIVISPLFALMAWPLFLILLARTSIHARKTHFSIHRFRLHMLTILTTLAVIPALIASLRWAAPSSTTAIGAFIKALYIYGLRPFEIQKLAELAAMGLAEAQRQDLHWQSSMALLALAATWTRFLPRGSGFWALAVFLLNLISLIIDGHLVGTLETQIPEISSTLAYRMTGSVTSMEPLLIGTAASYAWFAVRTVIISIFPGYSSPAYAHGRIK